ncbi:MAG: PilZ domain-containing protein [Spirochaetes bacterium]|nr:PilZ domain-containing protein [Spirochaetota bacterium]
MGLKAQQGIVLSSKKILNGQNLQALIKEISPDSLTLFIPLDNITIPKGTELTISFWDETANYEFNTKALTAKENKDTLIKIAKPTTLKKIIKRNFPRVVVKIEGVIYTYEGIEREKCIIVDVSAGGALVATKTGKKIGEVVKMSFTLPGGEIFEDVAGKIVWMKELNQALTNYGIQFLAISEIRKQKLVAFVNHCILKKKEEEKKDKK